MRIIRATLERPFYVKSRYVERGSRARGVVKYVGWLCVQARSSPPSSFRMFRAPR
jgi:hypothetical protein